MQDVEVPRSGFDGSPLRPDENQWLREFRHEQAAREKRREIIRRRILIYLSWLTGSGTVLLLAQNTGIVDWIAKLFVRGP
jgi:hypothetical protein